MTKTEVPVKHQESILDEITTRVERIRERAFELFQTHPGALDSELNDWLDAERQVAPEPLIELRQTDGKFEIEATLPGLSRHDLEVKVTNEDVLITTKPETRAAKSGDREERTSAQMFGAIHLPAPIDADHVVASFRKGTLRVTAPILRPDPARRIEVRA